MARTRQKSLEENPISAGSAPPPRAAPIPLPKGWARPKEALDSVTSVTTIFPDFNRAVRRGGLPTGRIITVHGPTHGGKSAFAIGLAQSFVAGGHVGALVDAEHATGQEFVEELMGSLEQRDNFYALRPHSYEETIDAVDSFLASVRDARKANAALRSICIIDSINKLVPKRELQQMLKQVSGGEDGEQKGRFKKEGGSDQLAKGHWGRARAALNQSWLDHLVPMLSDAGCALVLIAQEREDESEAWSPQEDFKIKGGAALRFDASLLIRVSKAQALYDPPSERKEPNIIGFAHRVRIHKSKVGHMDGRWTDCVFHLSNGRFAPAGFDTARDALHVAQQFGIVTVTSSWLSWRKRRWQGINKAVTALSHDPQQLAELLVEVNAAIDKQEGR